MAIESLSGDTEKDVGAHFLNDVEWFFSAYSTTEGTTRTAQLQGFVEQCIRFKRRLERQEFRFYFSSSAAGTVYNPDSMHSVSGNQNPDSIVILSLWPSIWRDTATNERQLIEPEQVWVKNGQSVKPEH